MKIAAVVIAHNVADWVAEALRSVLTQSRPLDSVVVVENGSTDGTARAVRGTLAELAPSDGRITLLSEDRLGPGGARNRGVELALEHGAEAIAFLDGDDWWSRRFVGCLEPMLAGARGRAAAFGWTIVRDTDGRFRGLRARLRRSFEYRDLCRFKSPMVTTSSLLVGAEALSECGGFRTDVTCGEDWEMLLRLTRSGRTVACARRFVVNYRKRPGSLTTEARRAVSGIEAIEAAHPSARRAKHWWWPLNLALRAGQWDLVDEILAVRPAVSGVDLMSAQFLKYLANRLRYSRGEESSR